MKNALAVLLLCAAPAAFGIDDASVAKGLQNLALLYRVGDVIELGRALPGTVPLRLPPDAWGNELRFYESAEGWRVVSAGSDGTFDESAWRNYEQFANLEGDVVFENGRLVRSNRNWLAAQAAAAGASAAALADLRAAEVRFAMGRVPLIRALTGAKATAVLMQRVAAYIENNKAAPPEELSRDAWGTPLRITIDGERYRIVSAGADKTFDETSWAEAPLLDLAEDIVLENGTLTRQISEEELLRGTPPLRADAVPQPPDPSLDGGRYLRIVPPIVAPQVETRVEPVYPEEYRRARVTGLVILEVAVSENGTVDHVSLRRSLAPELDRAAVNAVRQWKFKPATLDGKPVPALFHVTINFKLS